MKKRISFLLLLLLVSFALPFVIKATTTTNKLVVYYYRYDNNYTGFNFHFWDKAPKDSAGKDFQFNNDQVDSKYGAYTEVTLNDNDFDLSNTTRFGIIVKKGGWDGYREPGGDRFIEKDDMEVIDGKYRIYVVEGDLNIGSSTTDLENNVPNYNPKILRSDFNKNQDIDARFSEIPDKVEVLENNSVVFTKTTNLKKTELIKLTKTPNLGSAYLVRATFANDYTDERLVSITGLYDTEAFTNAFSYEGELGAIYTEAKTTFRLWAPISESVTLNIYKQGHPDYNNKGEPNKELTPNKTYSMTKIDKGAWEVVVDGNLANMYYTFSVKNYGQTNEVSDPYSFSTGANGLRSMITNFNELNPSGWSYNNRPDNIENLTDYIVYELQVRDLTTHESWNGNEDYRGKFLGFTEDATTYTNKDGITVTTGLEHLDELGINAVQLLPIFDFGYVDEVKMATDPSYTNTFNWGYMPYHFNTLEGSFSTNPFDGGTRVNEFKQLVQSLHDRDIRVIMDVVYNHTGESENSNFHKILPNYYHRINSDGGFANGSGTGNETASERFMMRKFMLDSLKFLVTEYNLSGFRFDLMALHDVQTMQEIEDMLYEIDPTIIIYGEPWHAGNAAIDHVDEAGKNNIDKFKNIGAFNDTTRDAIKGNGNSTNKSWVQGDQQANHTENIKYGIAGGTLHNQVAVTPWHGAPQRTINYVTAHDNLTLHDKLRHSGVRANAVEKMVMQANTIILTSQGIPFLHAGVDFMRSKPKDGGGYDNNSYESPDSVNQLRWDRKAQYINVFEYYKTIIQLRKHNPQFKMMDTQDINNYLVFTDTKKASVIEFKIEIPGYPIVFVAHNGSSRESHFIQLPEGMEFNIHTFHDEHSPFGIGQAQGRQLVTPNSSTILIESVDDKNIKSKKNVVVIDKNTNYNIFDNIVRGDNTKIYSSSYYNTSVPGKYTVNVSVAQSNGKITTLEYILFVKGKGSGVNVIGGFGS